MDKIIPFNKGIRRQPSLGEAGELSELVNLIPKGGELVNVKGEKKVVGIYLGSNDVYVGVMKSDEDYDVYIAVNENTIKYVVVEKGDSVYVNFTDEGDYESISMTGVVSNIRIFGKCLCFYAPSAHYLLLKGKRFVSFSEALGDLKITFGLQTSTELMSGDEYKETVPESWNGGIFTSADVIAEKFGSKIISYVNSVEAKGWFVNPFFVRYAFRMFDGNLKCQSAPVFMPCCDKYGVVACNITTSGVDIYGQFTAKALFRHFKHRLYYYAQCSRSELDSLSESISDIVQSVDIYICPIKMVRNIKGRVVGDSSDMFCYSTYNISTNAFTKMKIGASENIVNTLVFDNEESTNDEIKNHSVYYKLASIKLQDIQLNNYALIDTSEVDISTISTQEPMVDGYNESVNVSADVSFMYNNRMIRGDISRRLMYYTLLNKHIGCSFRNNLKINYNIVYEAEKNGEIVYLDGGASPMQAGQYGPYIFIQDPDVKNIYISNANSSGKYVKLQMTRHEFLYGAYCYRDMDNLLAEYNVSIPGTLKGQYAEKNRNVLQVSEANSPFSYLPKNELTVGNGEILGISTSAKALSQGQFGQFPLYVFCSDGIWALEVAEDGTFRSSQPISRDVCNNPDSITQIDGAVVFTTDQGLKMIQGSEVVLLSGYMDGYNVKEGDYFSSEYFKNKGYADFDGLVKEEDRDFRKILEKCRIAYDYPNNMLRIYPNANKGKYYVFDLGTREFSSCIDDTQVETVVADYPSSFVQKGDSVYSFDGGLRDGSSKGLLLTRPISLDDPSAFKKLQELKLYQTRTKNDSYAKVCLFVSNDGITWAEKKSLRGGSYRYFRFGVITSMKDDEALSGMAVRYETNRANKLR